MVELRDRAIPRITRRDGVPDLEALYMRTGSATSDYVEFSDSELAWLVAHPSEWMAYVTGLASQQEADLGMVILWRATGNERGGACGSRQDGASWIATRIRTFCKTADSVVRVTTTEFPNRALELLAWRKSLERIREIEEGRQVWLVYYGGQEFENIVAVLTHSGGLFRVRREP